MANDGYIKLYRKMMKWGWYTDTNTKCVFLHLLFMACYEPCYFKGIYLEQGQIITTVKEISEGTNISTRCVRTSLERLKSTNELTIKSTNKYSIITLNNYSDYQGTDKDFDKQLTNNRQTTDKRSYSKEIKEVKEVKNSMGKTKFSAPTLDEVKAYCSERNNSVDAERFYDYYSTNGWVQGKGKPIKDWKACVRTWERGFSTQKEISKEKPSFDLDALENAMRESDCVI